MAAVRRFLVFGAVLVTVLLLSAHGVQHLPATPNAHAAGPEAFTQALPDTVYEADPSHLGAAQANPALGLNGYCVDVVTENAIPIPNGASGFTVTGGVVLSHSAFTNGSGTAVDDFYCVVVASNVGVTSVGVAWNFTDSVTSIPGSANLTLAVVAVVLEATDGFVDPGPFAQVCTRGWARPSSPVPPRICPARLIQHTRSPPPTGRRRRALRPCRSLEGHSPRGSPRTSNGA